MKSCDARVRRIAYESTIQMAGNDTEGTGFNADSINALLDAAATRVDLSNVMLVFRDLPDGRAGEASTTGVTAQIILDTTAAGHGWYIDPTPLDNSDDYLPTSNPNVWQAKAGSAAAGKMDLLSVLLHEYGHALGLGHSADSGNYMAATLQPGERRLPSRRRRFG